MEFRVLGPIELWSAGRRQDLGRARARSILAMLLLNPRALVPAETLIDRLWDTQPPAKARESLSVYVARLRASLRQAVGDDLRLLGRAQGYLLEVDPETVDVHQFRRLRRQADTLAASGDHEPAAALLREADGLWRGQALAGIGGDWAARMREALEEERRAALLDRVGCELELGRHTDLVGELAQLLVQYPADETLVGHQMTALCRSGRPADALSLYRETRSRLIEEQGAEPGAALSDLHQRVLSRDPGLAVRPAGRRLAQAAPDTLPPETAEFVGRGPELALLTERTGGHPGIAIIEGMPGVGKTTLAIRAARSVTDQYPDGTIYLNLHSYDPSRPPLDPAEALYQLLQMLSVPAAQIPETIGERTALWRAQLTRRAAVVILDDAAGHDQLGPLLPVTSRCLILITTRRRLPDLGWARSLTLDVLPVGEAIALFRRISGASEAADVGQIEAAVQRCGRLPLAIQLAAGQLGRHGLPTAPTVPEPVGLLGGGQSSPAPSWPALSSPGGLGEAGLAAPEVTAAFDLSYGALEPDHQQLFRRLGVGPCATFGLPAVAALGGCTHAEAEKALGALLDHHLLVLAPGGSLRFHDLIHGYAVTLAARDDPAAERRQAVGRLIDYYLHAADQADRVLRPFRRRPARPGTGLPAGSPEPGTPEDATSWLESEWRNIVQVARYADRHEWKAKGADLIDLLADFMENSAYWQEAATAHALALQASREIDDPARIARAARALSAVWQQTGQREASIPLAEEAATLCRSLADRSGEARALDQLGQAYLHMARWRESLAYFEEARMLYGAAADQGGVADTLSRSGIVCWNLGRHPEAESRMRQALARYREIGDRRGEAKVLTNLGRVHFFDGYHRDALEAYGQALEVVREIGGAQLEAIIHQNIGSVHHYKGSHDEALAAYRTALTMYRDIGDRPNEAEALNDIGAIYESAACHDEALAHHQRARAIAEEVGNLSQQLIALRLIADIHRGSGRYGEAMDSYQAALRMAREGGEPYEEGKILEGMAEAWLNSHRFDAGRIALRQALDIYERLDVPEAESVRIRMETIVPDYAARIS
jgi:DNA-binding SARP family transcriptional activator/tetratricopeptide (TPR) repeat protein